MENINPIISEKRIAEVAQELWDKAGRPAVGPEAFMGKARERLEESARREHVKMSETNLGDHLPATPAPTQPIAPR